MIEIHTYRLSGELNFKLRINRQRLNDWAISGGKGKAGKFSG
jgi:hypothetical protein